MAKYIVKELSWIDNRLVQAGEVIEFEGIARANLEKVTGNKKRDSATDEPDTALDLI